MKIKLTALAIGLAIGTVVNSEVIAAGGQVQQNRQLIDQDTGDVIGIVVPTEACDNYEVVKDQSGKLLYVICTDVED